MANSDKTKVLTAEFRKNISEYLGRVQFNNETVLVVRRGPKEKLIAAVISPEDYKLLEAAKKAVAAPAADDTPAPASPAASDGTREPVRTKASKDAAFVL